MARKKPIKIDENFPADTCRYILTECSPYFYCPELRRDVNTAYCEEHHKLLYRGFTQAPWQMHKPDEKKEAA